MDKACIMLKTVNRLQISVVAANQLREGSANGATMPIDNQLKHVLVHLHHHRCHLFCGYEEEDGEDSHLKLRAHTDEGAPYWLHQPLPAELKIQDMVVFIGLEDKQAGNPLITFWNPYFGYAIVGTKIQTFKTISVCSFHDRDRFLA